MFPLSLPQYFNTWICQTLGAKLCSCRQRARPERYRERPHPVLRRKQLFQLKTCCRISLKGSIYVRRREGQCSSLDLLINKTMNSSKIQHTYPRTTVLYVFHIKRKHKGFFFPWNENELQISNISKIQGGALHNPLGLHCSSIMYSGAMQLTYVFWFPYFTTISL